MSFFYHDDNSELQGNYAIPTPVDGVGPTYEGGNIEPYYRVDPKDDYTEFLGIHVEYDNGHEPSNQNSSDRHGY